MSEISSEFDRRKLMKAATASVVGTIGATAATGTAAAHVVGTPCYTTTGLNIRTGPGLNYGVIRTADQNTPMRVIDGPWYSDGYKWWRHEVGGHSGHHGCYTGYAVEQYSNHADFVYPTQGTIISTYWDSRDGGSRYHRGCDISGSYGQSVRAAASGTVRQTNYDPPYGCGYYIEIDHAGSYITRYCHLSSIDVSVGQSVGRNQHIGKMGNSGCDCVTHLHFKLMRYDDCHTCALNWPMHQGACVYDGSGIEKNFPGI